MEKGEGETDAMYGEDAITPVVLAVHLDVVIAEFLNLAYDQWCLHQPRKEGIEAEYDLAGCELRHWD